MSITFGYSKNLLWPTHKIGLVLQFLSQGHKSKLVTVAVWSGHKSSVYTFILLSNLLVTPHSVGIRGKVKKKMTHYDNPQQASQIILSLTNHNSHPLIPEFLNLSNTDILNQIILFCCRAIICIVEYSRPSWLNTSSALSHLQ